MRWGASKMCAPSFLTSYLYTMIPANFIHMIDIGFRLTSPGTGAGKIASYASRQRFTR